MQEAKYEICEKMPIFTLQESETGALNSVLDLQTSREQWDVFVCH